jgi:hypothetical protein
MLVNVRHVATRQLWVVFSSVDITATINLQLDDRACLDKDEKGGASIMSISGKRQLTLSVKSLRPFWQAFGCCSPFCMTGFGSLRMTWFCAGR